MKFILLIILALSCKPREDNLGTEPKIKTDESYKEGYIHIPNLGLSKVKYLLQGDHIVIGDDQLLPASMLQSNNGVNLNLAAFTQNDLLWRTTEIPYVIRHPNLKLKGDLCPGVPNTLKAQFEEAIRRMMFDNDGQPSGFTFREKKEDDFDYLSVEFSDDFENGTIGLAYLGSLGGKQEISVSEECGGCGCLAHEIGHSLGFIHEHQRQDRDSFIIVPEQDKYSPIISMSKSITNLTRYDYKSIMHYGKLKKINGAETEFITTPSDLDYQGIRQMAQEIEKSFINPASIPNISAKIRKGFIEIPEIPEGMYANLFVIPTDSSDKFEKIEDFFYKMENLESKNGYVIHTINIRDIKNEKIPLFGLNDGHHTSLLSICIPSLNLATNLEKYQKCQNSFESFQVEKDTFENPGYGDAWSVAFNEFGSHRDVFYDILSKFSFLDICSENIESHNYMKSSILREILDFNSSIDYSFNESDIRLMYTDRKIVEENRGSLELFRRGNIAKKDNTATRNGKQVDANPSQPRASISKKPEGLGKNDADINSKRTIKNIFDDLSSKSSKIKKSDLIVGGTLMSVTLAFLLYSRFDGNSPTPELRFGEVGETCELHLNDQLVKIKEELKRYREIYDPIYSHLVKMSMNYSSDFIVSVPVENANWYNIHGELFNECSAMLEKSLERNDSPKVCTAQHDVTAAAFAMACSNLDGVTSKCGTCTVEACSARVPQEMIDRMMPK